MVDADGAFMMRAVELARKGEGHTRPNPAVGAVVVRAGKIIGEGWHRKAGCDHAEVAALKDTLKRGNSPKGATVYVTLEPCSRPGRVGACTDALVAASVRRVVYGATDPNPKNRGRAARVLRKAGISCAKLRTCDRDVRQALDRVICAFAKHVLTGRPYVTVKLAMSLDGRICDDWGDAKWVSSERARRTTGELRERVDAIMVGAETVRKDNPSLLSHGRRNDDLVRVIVSRSGKLPRGAQVFTDGRNPTLVYRDAKTALADLGKRGLMHVLCEGGLALARSLAEAGLVDEWITVLAPKVIGKSRISKATVIGKSRCIHDWP